MNFTITDKNGNKRTIELTEDKEKLGGVDDKLVIIKDGKKYYAPLVEKPSEEKYPRMYVIKKDGIKRYVGEIQKIPSGRFETPPSFFYMWDTSYRRIGWLGIRGKLQVPDNIKMLKVNNTCIKVLPRQKITITILEKPPFDSFEGSPYAPIILNKKICSAITFKPVSYTHLTLPTKRIV